MNDDYLYPAIPDEVRDAESSGDIDESPTKIRDVSGACSDVHSFCCHQLLVKVLTVRSALDSSRGIDLLVARTQATFATAVTVENEQLVRSFHRSLEHCESVSVHEDVDGRMVWLVNVEDAPKVVDTHAGNREIHFWPVIQMAPPYPRTSMLEDPIPRVINCRRMLRPEDLDAIRRCFPGSVGVRVIIAGWVVVLFRDKTSLRACWNQVPSPPVTVGARRLSYQIVDHRPTFVKVGYGYPVSEQSDGHAQASLGLRLRMADGRETITTTTHAFVRLARGGLPPLWRSVTDWYLRIRGSLANCRLLKLLSAIPAIGEMRLGRENTPLGKKIWLAGTGLEVRRTLYVRKVLRGNTCLLGWDHHTDVRSSPLRMGSIPVWVQARSQSHHRAPPASGHESARYADDCGVGIIRRCLGWWTTLRLPAERRNR